VRGVMAGRAGESGSNHQPGQNAVQPRPCLTRTRRPTSSNSQVGAVSGTSGTNTQKPHGRPDSPP
jgi:hypothetical protein